MADAPRNQSHRARSAPPRVQHRAAENTHARPEARSKAEPIAIPQTAAATSTKGKKAPGLEMEPAIATAGRSGELNITIEKFWVEVDGNLPAGFNVSTREGHGLDVRLEQLLYRRAYTGTGALQTGLTPVAPIGTKGKIVVTDTTTGETLEQPWTWRSRGSFSLWQRIKRLFWKG